jgi:Domain of unknown function (DUF4918)
MIAQDMLEFLVELEPPRVQKGITVMNPYRNAETQQLVKTFYETFYADSLPRTLLLGINPGRFGAGMTGIPFTDPIRLEKDCGIPNRLPKKPELSSDFIYRMISALGGPKKFYSKYLISAVSPLGFTRDGKNINYYDDKKLQQTVQPFAIACINRLVGMGAVNNRCFCIGEGKNFDFLIELNEEHRWFDHVIPLAHPRFIMQYKRKLLDRYIRGYLDQLA